MAIIPARGGSKGISRKNIKPLAGKPLIAHTVEHARSAKSISRVFVSTEDAEIASVSEAYGAEVVHRPLELASDTATSESALLHALNHIENGQGLGPDIIVFLQCTSPIRRPDDIDNAVEILINEEADSLLSVCRSHRFIWRNQENELQSLNYDYRNRRMRQDLAPEYAENGSFYIFRPWVLKELGNRLGGKIAFHEMNLWSSFEIDSLEDFELCEWIILREKRRKHISLLPSNIELVVFDFDGVFTDNRVILNENGLESVVCSRGDGSGISQLKQKGIPIIVLSAEENKVVGARCSKLGIECFQGIDEKLDALREVLSRKGIDTDNVIYVGNDTNDLKCIAAVGCGIAVADAHPQVLSVADIILESNGGHGAIRELCDLIIEGWN